MPATKKKSKSKKKPAKRKGTRRTSGVRHAEGYCGECRVRTKGMKVGDVRRRISSDGKKLKVERVA